MDSLCCILFLLYLTPSTFAQFNKINFFDVNNDAVDFPLKFHRSKRSSILPEESNSNSTVHNCKENSCKNDTRSTNTVKSNSNSTNAVLKVSSSTTERSLQALINETERRYDSSKTKLTRNRRTVITLSTLAAVGGLSIISSIIWVLRVVRWFFGYGWDIKDSTSAIGGVFGFIANIINVFARFFGIELDVNMVRDSLNVTEKAVGSNYLTGSMNGINDASGMYPIFSNMYSNYYTNGHMESSNGPFMSGQVKLPFVPVQSADINLLSGQATLNVYPKQVVPQKAPGYLSGSFSRPVQYLKTESINSPVYSESEGSSVLDLSNAITVTNAVTKELSNGQIVIEFIHPITNQVIRITRDGNTEYVNPDTNQEFVVYIDTSGRIILVLKDSYMTPTHNENSNYNVLIAPGTADS